MGKRGTKAKSRFNFAIYLFLKNSIFISVASSVNIRLVPVTILIFFLIKKLKIRSVSCDIIIQSENALAGRVKLAAVGRTQ
jgi:hypothetical protein